MWPCGYEAMNTKMSLWILAIHWNRSSFSKSDLTTYPHIQAWSSNGLLLWSRQRHFLSHLATTHQRRIIWCRVCPRVSTSGPWSQFTRECHRQSQDKPCPRLKEKHNTTRFGRHIRDTCLMISPPIPTLPPLPERPRFQIATNQVQWDQWVLFRWLHGMQVLHHCSTNVGSIHQSSRAYSSWCLFSSITCQWYLIIVNALSHSLLSCNYRLYQVRPGRTCQQS